MIRVGLISMATSAAFLVGLVLAGISLPMWGTVACGAVIGVATAIVMDFLEAPA